MLPGRGARAREGTRNDDPSCHIGATPAPFGPVTCDTVGPGGPHGCRREPVVGTPGESSYHGRMPSPQRSEEHTSELQSRGHLVCRLLLEKKKIQLLIYVQRLLSLALDVVDLLGATSHTIGADVC